VEDRLTCDQAGDQLPEYLAALEVGQGKSPAWDHMHLHLAACTHCARIFADLRDLLSLVDNGPVPPYYPTLREPTRPAMAGGSGKGALADGQVYARLFPIWRLDELGRLVIDLLGALAPPAHAAGLKMPGGAAVLGELTVDDAAPDLHLRVALLGIPEDRRRSLMVTVEIPSRGGWPNLGGSEVRLLRSGNLINTQRTDAFGAVIFTGLTVEEVAHLAVAVLPA
jgi:hypothetical protein